jgi:hypothetical protein
MTDTSGKYVFSNLNVGTYTINVTALGYPNTTFTATITAGQNTTKDIQLKMTTYAKFTVKNFDGTLISGATVSAGSLSGTTDASGQMNLSLTPGNYTLTVKASGYKTLSQGITVTKGPNEFEATIVKPISAAEATGLMALLFGALCLILFLPLLIIIIVIVVVIIYLRRKKKAKAAAEAAAAPPAAPAAPAPPAPAQPAAQPGATGVPPPPGQGPPTPPPPPGP